MADTAIEWTQRSWNPIVGCSLESPGCTHCYAMRMARRLELMGTVAHYAGLTRETKAGPVWTGKLALAPEHVLLEPLRRRKPTTWFVNSMGDLFHESVPDEWIDRVFAVMALCPQHSFQVLTKRAARMRAYVDGARNRVIVDNHVSVSGDAEYFSTKRLGATWPWPLPNVWLGVSAEDQRRADERIPELLATPAVIRFVSAEPLLGPIDFNCIPRRPDEADRIMPGFSNVATFIVSALRGQRGLQMRDCTFWGEANSPTLDWIIVGGESGPKARPMHPDWARSIRDQCAAAGTAFFFKQWGEFRPLTSAERGQACGATLIGSDRYDRDAYVLRVGKKRAGRLLDGVEHNAMPEVRR